MTCPFRTCSRTAMLLLMVKSWTAETHPPSRDRFHKHVPNKRGTQADGLWPMSRSVEGCGSEAAFAIWSQVLVDSFWVKEMGVCINGGIQNGWCIMENPMKMDDLRVPPFMESPKSFHLPCWGLIGHLIVSHCPGLEWSRQVVWFLFFVGIGWKHRTPPNAYMCRSKWEDSASSECCCFVHWTMLKGVSHCWQQHICGNKSIVHIKFSQNQSLHQDKVAFSPCSDKAVWSHCTGAGKCPN